MVEGLDYNHAEDICISNKGDQIWTVTNSGDLYASVSGILKKQPTSRTWSLIQGCAYDDKEPGVLVWTFDGTIYKQVNGSFQQFTDERVKRVFVGKDHQIYIFSYQSSRMSLLNYDLKVYDRDTKRFTTIGGVWGIDGDATPSGRIFTFDNNNDVYVSSGSGNQYSTQRVSSLTAKDIAVVDESTFFYIDKSGELKAVTPNSQGINSSAQRKANKVATGKNTVAIIGYSDSKVYISKI